jgi:hypothetical protein
VTTSNHGRRDEGPRVGDRSASVPDQNATVVIADGVDQETWLVVSGGIERRVALINPNLAGPGKEPAIEIVYTGQPIHFSPPAPSSN